MSSNTVRHASRCIVLALAAAALTTAAQAGGHSRGGDGQGYGNAGGVTDYLALSNVFSGIYGTQYTFDREHYDFNRCPPEPTAGSQLFTDPNCRR